MNFWRNIMHVLLHQREIKAKAEVDRIGKLQQAAKQRRAEFAADQEQATRTGAATPKNALADSRKLVIEAEAAYATAIQAWDNKQFRR